MMPAAAAKSGHCIGVASFAGGCKRPTTCAGALCRAYTWVVANTAGLSLSNPELQDEFVYQKKRRGGVHRHGCACGSGGDPQFFCMAVVCTWALRSALRAGTVTRVEVQEWAMAVRIACQLILANLHMENSFIWRPMGAQKGGTRIEYIAVRVLWKVEQQQVMWLTSRMSGHAAIVVQSAVEMHTEYASYNK